MLSDFMVAHQGALLDMAASRLRKLYPGAFELDQIRAENLSTLLHSIVSALRTHEAEGPDAKPRVAVGSHLSDAQFSFDIDELIYQYESLCHSVNEAANQLEVVIPPADQQKLNMALDDCIARTVIGWEHEKRKSRETIETQRLGFVAHELRNALHTAMTSFKAIRSGRIPLLGATGDIVERSHARLTALIENLLQEVRIGATVQRDHVRLCVRELLDESISFVAQAAAEKDIGLLLDIDGALEIDGEHELLITAVTNLLQNAVKFTLPGRPISVRAQATSQGQALIEVEDGCGGLPAVAVERLFKPFVQAGSDRSGLGLGLAIAQQVVKAHGGTLAVKNLPGRGCRFVVGLPLSPIAGERAG